MMVTKENNFTVAEADQALFNSLHSYHGNFTIMTQGEQYVTYIADTKLYIDKLIGA